jgi:hypothetical protein
LSDEWNSLDFQEAVLIPHPAFVPAISTTLSLKNIENLYGIAYLEKVVNRT